MPRKKIPSGSSGLAGQYSGDLPERQSGGWQLIGTTAEKMWDLERKNPALLLPGMTVHFEDVTYQPTTVSVAQQVTRTVEPKYGSMPLFTVNSTEPTDADSR